MIKKSLFAIFLFPVLGLVITFAQPAKTQQTKVPVQNAFDAVAPSFNVPFAPAAPNYIAPPKHVKVGHLTYRIEMVPGLFQCGKEEHALGCTDSAKSLIRVSADMSLEYEKYAVMHELIHAAAFNGGNGQATGNDEAWAQALGHPLVAILEENPEIVLYLTQ